MGTMLQRIFNFTFGIACKFVNPAFVAANILLYCLGFGLTLLVLGYIISSMDISRFAKKTEHIQKIFAILIIFGAIYMLITALGGIL